MTRYVLWALGFCGGIAFAILPPFVVGESPLSGSWYWAAIGFSLAVVLGLAWLIRVQARYLALGLAWSVPPFLLLALFAWGLLRGFHTWEDAGGGWRIRRTEALADSYGEPTLFRMHGSRRTQVIEFTYVYHYYGNDCIGFASLTSAYFACGDRQPIELLVPDLPHLHFAAAGAVQGSGNGLNPWEAVLATPAELTQKAVTQRHVTAYDFRAPLERIDLRSRPLPGPLGEGARPSGPRD